MGVYMAKHSLCGGRTGGQSDPEASVGKGTSVAVIIDDRSGDCPNYEHIGEALPVRSVCSRTGCNPTTGRGLGHND